MKDLLDKAKVADKSYNSWLGPLGLIRPTHSTMYPHTAQRLGEPTLPFTPLPYLPAPFIYPSRDRLHLTLRSLGAQPVAMKNFTY